jgi:hypothetical protein
MPPDKRNPANGGRVSRNRHSVQDDLPSSIAHPRISCPALPAYHASGESDRLIGVADWLRQLEAFARDINLKSALTVALVHDDLVAMVTELEDRISHLECSLDEATPANAVPAETKRAAPEHQYKGTSS